jgi:hypothetical protein
MTQIVKKKVINYFLQGFMWLNILTMLALIYILYIKK